MIKNIDKELEMVNQLSGLIRSDYFSNAKLDLQINKGDKNSIIISVENNPWRNGVIKGDMLFCRIKSGGKVQYLQIKETYSKVFSEIGVNYTANKTELNEGFIRINLSDFCNMLDKPNEEFIYAINLMYLNNISFSAFGCCSKYAECEQQGKCLHTDQLYATACQWQECLKRSGKFESA